MELKKQIETFRSQALMSRYNSAIKLGYKILSRLEFLSNVFKQDFSQIQQQLTTEINFCIQLNKFVSPETQENPLLLIPKKQEEPKDLKVAKCPWNRKNKTIHHIESQQNENRTECQNQNLQVKSGQDEDEDESIEQKLHKHLILPLNMPLFKLKNSVYLIKTQNCLREVFNYLLHYDFRQLESLEISDLGVQNILNVKKEMVEANQNRGIIVIEKSITKSQQQRKNEINKLRKIIQAYRSLGEENQNEKKAILVFLVQEQLPFLKKQQRNFDSKQRIASLKKISFI